MIVRKDELFVGEEPVGRNEPAIKAEPVIKREPGVEDDANQPSVKPEARNEAEIGIRWTFNLETGETERM